MSVPCQCRNLGRASIKLGGKYRERLGFRTPSWMFHSGQGKLQATVVSTSICAFIQSFRVLETEGKRCSDLI